MPRLTGPPNRRLGLPVLVGCLVVGLYGVAALLFVASSFWGWRGAYEVVSVLCLVFAAACAGRAARSAAGRRTLLELRELGPAPDERQLIVVATRHVPRLDAETDRPHRLGLALYQEGFELC